MLMFVRNGVHEFGVCCQLTCYGQTKGGEREGGGRVLQTACLMQAFLPLTQNKKNKIKGNHVVISIISVAL